MGRSPTYQLVPRFGTLTNDDMARSLVFSAIRKLL
jgi:hypothetical protein